MNDHPAETPGPKDADLLQAKADLLAASGPDLAAIRAKHIWMEWINYPDRPKQCIECRIDWPCEVAAVLLALETQAERLARAETLTTEAIHRGDDLAVQNAQARAEVVEQRRELDDLQEDRDDLETISKAVQEVCAIPDGEEAYGWLAAQAVRALAAEVVEQRGRAERLQEALGEMEFGGDDETCAFCYGDHDEGHSTGCPMAALLARLGGGA